MGSLGLHWRGAILFCLDVLPTHRQLLCLYHVMPNHVLKCYIHILLFHIPFSVCENKKPKSKTLWGRRWGGQRFLTPVRLQGTLKPQTYASIKRTIETSAPLGHPQYDKNNLTMSAASYHASSPLIPGLLHFANSFFMRVWRLRFLLALRLRESFLYSMLLAAS